MKYVDSDPPRPFSRRWIAWKLVQLAARLYDDEYAERIVIASDNGDVGEFLIVSSVYGRGVSSYVGYDKVGNCSITWEEFTPEWWNE